MLFSFLIASVSAGPAHPTGIGPSPMPTNLCAHGAVDREFVVTLNPPPPPASRVHSSPQSSPANSRVHSSPQSSDTQDKVSYIRGWAQQYDPEYNSSGTTRRKLEANPNFTHVLHLLPTQLAAAVSASNDVRPAPLPSTRAHRHVEHLALRVAFVYRPH